MLQLHPCSLQVPSGNFSMFTWASLSPSYRSPSNHKFNKKPVYTGTHPTTFWNLFIQNLQQQIWQSLSLEGQRYLFFSSQVRWNLSLSLYTRDKYTAQIRFQPNSPGSNLTPSVVTSLTSSNQSRLTWPENLARFPSNLRENNQCLPWILPPKSLRYSEWGNSIPL